MLSWLVLELHVQCTLGLITICSKKETLAMAQNKTFFKLVTSWSTLTILRNNTDKMVCARDSYDPTHPVWNGVNCHWGCVHCTDIKVCQKIIWTCQNNGKLISLNDHLRCSHFKVWKLLAATWILHICSTVLANLKFTICIAVGPTWWIAFNSSYCNGNTKSSTLKKKNEEE